METIRSKYNGDLRTESVHMKSGEKIITDAPVDNQGKGEAFSPTDLLSASLGSCMMTTMGIAGRTHNIDVEGMKMKITKVMASNPRRVSEIIIDFDISGKNYSEKEKQVLEKTAYNCPVALSLHSDIKQTVNFTY